MTFENKIKHSVIMNQGLQKKGKKIKTGKKRLLSLLLSLALVLYTVYTLVLKINKLRSDDLFTTSEITVVVLTVIVLSFKVLYGIINSFMKNTLYMMNHYGKYYILSMLSNLNLLFLFILNMYNYITVLDLINLWNHDISFLENFKFFFANDFKDTLFFIVTIVINLPVLLKFLGYTLKHYIFIYLSFPTLPAAPILFILFLTKYNDVFYEYENYDEEYYLVRKRKIKKTFYGFSCFIKKLIYMAILYGIITFITFAFISNTMTSGSTTPFPFYLISLFPFAYFVNLSFFSKVFISIAIEKFQKKTIKDSIDVNHYEYYKKETTMYQNHEDLDYRVMNEHVDERDSIYEEDYRKKEEANDNLSYDKANELLYKDINNEVSNEDEKND